MDRSDFERKCQKIQQGEFIEDPSIFEYANDSFYELKKLFTALRQCCDWQKQKIAILRKLNSGLEDALRQSRRANEILREKLVAMGVNPDEMQ